MLGVCNPFPLTKKVAMNVTRIPFGKGACLFPLSSGLLSLMLTLTSPDPLPFRTVLCAAEGAAPSREKKKEGIPAKLKAPPRLPVPLTSGRVEFTPGADGTGAVVATNASTSIVFGSNEKKRFEGLDTLQAQKIHNAPLVVKLADKSGDHYAVIEAYMVGEDTDALITKVNRNQPALYLSMTNFLSTLTVADFDRPGGANLLRAQLLERCQKLLGRQTLDQIVITRRLYR